MAYFDAAAGAATLRIEGNVGAVSGNSSRVDWAQTLFCYNGSSFHLSNNIGWSTSIAGNGYSGTFSFDFRSTNTKVIATGSTWVAHDANGYATISISGFKGVDGADAIADNVTASGSFALPRIPKPPAAPGAPAISDLAPTSATATWTGSPDAMGAAIDQYKLRVNTASPADSPGYVDYDFSGSTLTTPLTGLTPGTGYHAVTYAHNAQGYSVKSAETAFKTLSGAYVFNGSTWRPAELLVRNAAGTAWVTGEVFGCSGGAWVGAS